MVVTNPCANTRAIQACLRQISLRTRLQRHQIVCRIFRRNPTTQRAIDRNTLEGRANNGIKGARATRTFQQRGTLKCRWCIASEKYQTGFDQPLPHHVYVDKRLAGIRVQPFFHGLIALQSLILQLIAVTLDEIYAAFKPHFSFANYSWWTDQQQPSIYWLHKLREQQVFFSRWGTLVQVRPAKRRTNQRERPSP